MKESDAFDLRTDGSTSGFLWLKSPHDSLEMSYALKLNTLNGAVHASFVSGTVSTSAVWSRTRGSDGVRVEEDRTEGEMEPDDWLQAKQEGKLPQSGEED